MLKSECGRFIIHCDRCNARLTGEALPSGREAELAARARAERWRVEREAGTWVHTCYAHPPKSKQARLL